MSRLGLAYRAIRLTLRRATADPTADYDLASTTYDDAFTSVMGPHSTALLNRVRVQPGLDVVELACGTGHLTSQIVQRLAGRGTVAVVEKSAGMLTVAREKVERLGTTGTADGEGVQVTWEQGDMLDFLKGRPTDSADVLVCGWAICYTKPVELFREVDRVLRPGGQVGIIETRADALGVLRDAFEDVVSHDPSLLVGLPKVSLPRTSAVLDGWLRKGGLNVVQVGEGEQVWPVTTTDEALEWVQRSGAGAGFRDSFDMTREDDVLRLLGEALEKQRDRKGGLRLSHPFVWGVAEVAGGTAVPWGSEGARAAGNVVEADR